jgi:hypothetical protein
MRSIRAPFLVALPAAARIRTRLRVGEQDAVVLHMVGEKLGRLASTDLAGRCRLGRGHDRRGERKRALTAQSSSRWAGAITRTSGDQWTCAHQNLLEERVSLRRRLRTIDRRLTAPVGRRAGRLRGYASRAERWAKQRRRQRLCARLAEVEGRLAAGRVGVVRGGRRLARLRHHLDDAGLTLPAWRDRWMANRLFLTADGEADKQWGNETIRWHPNQQWLEVKLPSGLAHLANRPHGRYRLSCPVTFTHRGDEVAAQATSGAVRYDLAFDPGRGRWYLAASWRIAPVPVPSLQELYEHRRLSVDLNAGHLACWVVTGDGNPLGRPHTIPLAVAGLPASTRDGRLRAAISQLLALAKAHGCEVIAVEDLHFTDARHAGREHGGRGRRGRRFRGVVAGLPTRAFRERLVQMAHNQGLWVVAVDPAYTSKWAGQHWQQPLDYQTRPSVTVTRHHAAAVVIGRRSLGHSARRRPGVSRPHQWMGKGELPARPGVVSAGCQGPGPPQGLPAAPDGAQDRLGRPIPPGDQAAQDRSGRPEQDSLLLGS